MVTPRIVDDPDALVPRGGTADRIMGTNESERWLKTNFKSPQAALAFDVVRVHGEHMIELIQRLSQRQDNTRPSTQDVRREYANINRWLEWHQKGTGHLASVDGFSVKAAIRAADMDLDVKAGLGSSTRLRDAKKTEKAAPERLDRREGSL